MTLLEAINSKNTVKTFQSRKVGDEIFQGILKFAEILQLPMASAAVDLEVAGSAGDARRQLGVKAPYFLFIYTENQEEGSLDQRTWKQNSGFPGGSFGQRQEKRPRGSCPGFWMAAESWRGCALWG